MLEESIIIKLREVLNPSYLQDAIYILSLSDDKFIQSFNYLYSEQKFNSCCAVIDFARYTLIKENKITSDEYNSFGGYLFDLE